MFNAITVSFPTLKHQPFDLTSRFCEFVRTCRLSLNWIIVFMKKIDDYLREFLFFMKMLCNNFLWQKLFRSEHGGACAWTILDILKSFFIFRSGHTQKKTSFWSLFSSEEVIHVFELQENIEASLPNIAPNNFAVTQNNCSNKTRMYFSYCNRRVEESRSSQTRVYST